MIIDKKRIFLYSSILLLILVGVYFVESLGYASRTPTQTFVNTTGEANATNCVPGTGVVFCGSEYSNLINWTRGGNIETFLAQINLSTVLSATANNNISRINITLPSGFGSAAIFGGLNNVSFPNDPTNFNWTGTAFSGYVTFFNYTYNFTNGSGYGNTRVTLGGPRGLYETIRVMFNATAINGTEQVLNWTVILYNITGLGNEALATLDSGLGLLTGIDGLAPRSNGTNVTDSTNTRTSFTSTQYLKYDNTTKSNNNTGINITIMLTDYNMDRVILVYNRTGGTLNLTAIRNDIHGNVSRLNHTSTINSNSSFNGEFLGSSSVTGIGLSVVGNATGLLNLDTRSRLTSVPSTYQFVFNISNFAWGAADGTQFRYVFVVYDLYNNTEIINNSNADFVIVRDISNPTAALTAPSDTSIDLFGPIKYKCDGSDTSGLNSCTTTLTKPNSVTVTKTGCATEQTFTGDDNNQAGTHTVECKVQDNVGRVTTTSKTYTVSAGAAGGGAGGGGGGGGGAGSSPDNPVTVQTGESIDAGTLSSTETYTSVAKEGTVSFTVAGSSHSAKVLEVTEDSVTVEISSTPQTVTLTIGETKEVDLTDDGTNDLSVTLRSITYGKADLVFKSLEVVAPGEEVPGEKKPGVVTGEEAKPSLTWLWIVLVVVVVVLVIWYLGRKKQ